MAKLTEYLSKTLVRSRPRRGESLADLIPRIQEESPPRYFGGQGSPPVEILPRNILLFPRLRRQQLLGSLPASHHRFVLILNEGGDGTVVVDDMLVSLSPGQALLLFPYQYHHYSDLRQDRLCWLFLTFDLPDFQPLEKLRYRPVFVGEAARGHIRRICEQWLRLSRNSAGTSEAALVLECAMLLLELLRRAGRKKSEFPVPPADKTNQALLQSIGEYLHRHLDRPVSIADLAEQVSLSESHLRSRFRRCFGMSLGQYVRRTKLTRAAHLLDVTDMTIGQVAQACGFDSLYSFSRAFRRDVGLSPRQYRRERKQQ